MESLLIVLIFVVVSFALAEALFKVRRLPFCLSGFIHSGIGFVIIGVLSGPLFLNILDSDRLDLMVSPTSIALSWAGLVFGLQFRIQTMKLIAKSNYVMSFAQGLLTFLIVFLVLLPMRWIMPGIFISFKETLPFIIALSAIASISSPLIVSSTIRRLNAHGTAARILKYITSSDACVGVIIYGMAMSFFRTESISGNFFNGIVWCLATLGLGLLLGFLFHIFISRRLPRDDRLVVAVGMIVLTAGAASILNISPFFLSVFTGFVVTNFADNQDRLFRLLCAAEKPLFGFMLILLGAHFLMFENIVIIFGLYFVAARIIGKIIGMRYAIRCSSIKDSYPNAFGLALIGQGGIAVALSLDFIMRYPGWSGEFVASIVLVSFVISGLFGPYLIKSLMKKEGGYN